VIPDDKIDSYLDVLVGALKPQERGAWQRAIRMSVGLT